MDTRRRFRKKDRCDEFRLRADWWLNREIGHRIFYFVAMFLCRAIACRNRLGLESISSVSHINLLAFLCCVKLNKSICWARKCRKIDIDGSFVFFTSPSLSSSSLQLCQCRFPHSCMHDIENLSWDFTYHQRCSWSPYISIFTMNWHEA